MRALLTALAVAAFLTASAPPRPSSDLARWRREAANVTIVRDTWGIAHVRGRTDADAVFGMIYAQAEDDFNRVESNYLTALGRDAQVQGASAIYQDLRMRLFVDPAVLRRQYAGSPAPLKTLMNAWADGLNYYLATHPAVHPQLIRRFEPWMALSFTEGSIGGDVERVSLPELASFYGGARQPVAVNDPANALEDAGSNGIAIAPSRTRDRHALLLINPHTSFYFRSELQMTSRQGLNAYGAATWGQFFIYQGFNDHIGWMHTSTGVDNVDFFAERVARRGGTLYYRYGSREIPVTVSRIVIPYRTGSGMAQRTFTVYRTRHGPIVAKQNGRWIAIALMQRPIAALSQSYYRTKATSLAAYQNIANEYKANSSNNTIFADDKGDIMFTTPQFIPRRDDRFDYTHPVDGSNPATDWRGLHSLASIPHVIDPPNGWVFNSNDWPYSAAGPYSPKRADFPKYMDTAGENERGVHELRLLTGHSAFTLDSLMGAAFDSYIPAFADLVPRLVRAYDRLPANDAQKLRLAGPIGALRGWNDRWSGASVPTTLAVYYGEALGAAVNGSPGSRLFDRLRAASAAARVAAMDRATQHLTADFGSWKVPWGNVNRFQRLDDAIVPHFSDAAPSIPVPFTSGFWGSLAAFYTVQTGTKRRYGVSGNSFVAVVEFGKRIRARAVTAGGESGNPSSRHFDDEAQRYADGDLREVYFYPGQLKGHTERTYHPGE